MSYITKNANLLLLFLIVLIAGSLVGATVYFQARFTNVNGDYDAKLAELKNVTDQVNQYQETLQKAQIELELKSSREEQFTEKYTEAKATTDQLQKTSAELEKDVADLTAQVAAKASQVSMLQSPVAELANDLDDEKKKTTDLADELEELDDRADCLESTDDANEGNC